MSHARSFKLLRCHETLSLFISTCAYKFMKKSKQFNYIYIDYTYTHTAKTTNTNAFQNDFFLYEYLYIMRKYIAIDSMIFPR